MHFERFLDRDMANAYSVKHHHIWRALPEVMASSSRLHKTYSAELLEAERFRFDLAKALSSSSEDGQKIAERWAHFLKGRIVVYEFWSSMFATFGAFFGVVGALFTLAPQITKQQPFFLELLVLIMLSTLFLGGKFAFDKKSLWFKFVVSHLDALAKVGVNPSLGRATTSKSHGVELSAPTLKL